jgi:hypothetical protein
MVAPLIYPNHYRRGYESYPKSFTPARIGDRRRRPLRTRRVSPNERNDALALPMRSVSASAADLFFLDRPSTGGFERLNLAG